MAETNDPQPKADNNLELLFTIGSTSGVIILAVVDIIAFQKTLKKLKED